MQAAIDLSYPIGKFDWKQPMAPEERAAMIDIIAGAPARFRDAVNGLDEAQLDTRYRPDGWTVRQVVHHVADSHMNAFLRFRWALTEENPPIRGYNQVKWAELHDSRTLPVEVSLGLLQGLHARWVDLLQSMRNADFARTLVHSELGPVSLDQVLWLYAWHSRHHAAHITGLRERMGWAR
jgi:uncharacterized damage-inducible protein DinB